MHPKVVYCNFSHITAFLSLGARFCMPDVSTVVALELIDVYLLNIGRVYRKCKSFSMDTENIFHREEKNARAVYWY